MRLRARSLRCDSVVVVSGPASAVDYGTEWSSLRDPVASEPASVRGIGAALRWFSVRPGYVSSPPSLLGHAPPNLLRVIPGDGCLADEGVLVGVVAIDEAVPISNVKSF